MNTIVLKTIKAELYCVECGKQLTGKQEKFCSPKCRNVFNGRATTLREKVLGIKRIRAKKVTTLKQEVCLVCGKQLTGIQRKFCSPQCGWRARLEKLKEERSIKRTRYTHCEFCGSLLSGDGWSRFCDKECCRMWHKRNKISKNHSAKMHYVIVKGGHCQKCGYSKNIASLCFHHLDPSKKTFNLTGQNLQKLSEKVVMEELENCLLLCNNCHSEIHNPELDGLLDDAHVSLETLALQDVLESS